MKNFFLAVFGIIILFLFSCNFGRKDDIKEGTVSKEVSVIFENNFEFNDSVEINKIEIKKISENRYKLSYFLDEKSDFNFLKGLNIGFRVYPKNPKRFLNEEDRISQAKTISSKCEIKLNENNLVIISDEFILIPSEFKEVKVFIYNPSEGVVGRTMTILDVNL